MECFDHTKSQQNIINYNELRRFDSEASSIKLLIL